MTVRSLLAVAGILSALGCGRDAAVPRDGDGLDVSGQPQQFKDDYALFANRCSKCHGLARPLNLASHETSDEYWERYVERMRRQPGSGISPEDAVAIRRFLHVYSRLEKARHQREGDSTEAGAPPSSTSRESTDGGMP